MGSPVSGFLPLRSYFSLTENFPAPADKYIFAVSHEPFYQLEKGVDDLGRQSLAENVLGGECFHDLGLVGVMDCSKKVENRQFV